MQKAAENNIATETVEGNDAYRSIVSDLKCLIGQVQASLSRVESAIACEASLASAEAIDDDIIVLDDITPRYARAGEVLKACDADLGAALEFLLEVKAMEHRLN
ncbi:hypothetical protein I6F35_30410 [Bradyrhizobium sp. BRP22]|uniref:hypothetical protein n=1 Tax=Bradyrhizobium sp. BRP22 TaxID=2793821 RepID=UPI001CD798BF|nr:hypothetical protein [Bradyrhizobium sp. BRP22]MCA1457456.1 hypothetical protein [Bradyrhizobium sp. BRP22]